MNYSWVESEIFRSDTLLILTPRGSIRFDFINFRFVFNRNSIEEGKSCSFMTCYNSNMSILLGTATSDWKKNARFGIHIPKNHYEQLD